MPIYPKYRSHSSTTPRIGGMAAVDESDTKEEDGDTNAKRARKRALHSKQLFHVGRRRNLDAEPVYEYSALEAAVRAFLLFVPSTE